MTEEDPPVPENVAAGIQKVRPVITPDAFTGEPTSNWDDWIGHFESVARVNGWDEPTRLLWLEVRMTGKAQKAWKRLTQEAKAEYDTAKEALRKRFEPTSRRELYAVEFQTRRRRREETWEELADSLRLLADKAFPDLQDDAKEQLSLDRFLTLLDKSELALGVRQRRPKTIDDALAYTLETESYMTLQSRSHQQSMAVSSLTHSKEDDTTSSHLSIVGAVQAKQDAMLEMIKTLSNRLERLEQMVSGSESSGNSSGGTYVPRKLNTNPPSGDITREPITCRKCGMVGHFARGCAANRGTSRPTHQGNY